MQFLKLLYSVLCTVCLKIPIVQFLILYCAWHAVQVDLLVTVRRKYSFGSLKLLSNVWRLITIVPLHTHTQPIS